MIIVYWACCWVEVIKSTVSISQVPGATSLVDIHISQARLKPPDPNAYEVAPRLIRTMLKSRMM